MTQRRILGIFLFALAIRLIYAFVFCDGPGGFYQPDTLAYDVPARGLVEHGVIGLPRADGGVPYPFTERVPGYIYFLALMRLLFGSDPLAVVAVQSVIDAATCVLIGRLAHRIRPGLFVPAGVVAGASPILFIHSALLLSDSLFMLPFTLFLTRAVDLLREPTPRAGAMTGFWLGLATLVRPVTWYFTWLLPLVLLPLLPRDRLRTALAAGLVAVMTVFPWVARNGLVTGHWQLSHQAGHHALLWLVPLAREYGEGIPMQRTQVEMQERLLAHLRARNQEDLLESHDVFLLTDEERVVAAQALLEIHPMALARAWIAGSLINLGVPALIAAPAVQQMERPSFYGVQGTGVLDKLTKYLSSAGTFLPVLVLSLAGSALAWVFQGLGLLAALRGGWQPRILIFLVLVAGYVLAVTGPITGVKYRLPLEPALIALLAQGLVTLYAWRRHRR